MDASVQFFTDVAGLDETGRDDTSVYLRCWGYYFHHTLKLTQRATPGLAGLGWRADSPEALADAVAYLESTSAGRGWVDGDLGHGRAYRFMSPDGHLHEVFWDVVWLKETGERASVFTDRFFIYLDEPGGNRFEFYAGGRLRGGRRPAGLSF